MFGLPKSTQINKQLPKRAIFDTYKPSPTAKKLFDEQIHRLSIVAEISPQTVNISSGDEVKAIFILLLTLKTSTFDKNNIVLLSKAIEQKMLFALQYADEIRFAAYQAGKVLISASKPADSWELTLNGLDLDTSWDNLLADIMGISLTIGKTLDEIISENEKREKLMQQTAVLEKKAMDEKQPRRKLKLVQELNKLKSQLHEE